MKLSPYFSREEYERRWDAVHAEIERRGYEVALVFGQTGFNYERSMDLLYLSGYASAQEHEPDTALWNARSYAAVILEPGRPPELHTDEADPPTDLIAVDDAFGHDDVIAGVARALNARGIDRRVAFVGDDFLPMRYGRQLAAASPTLELIAEDDLLSTVRRIKSPPELDCLRHAGEIVSRAVNRLMEGLIRGDRESEAAAAAAAEVVRAGGAYHAIPCCHGEDTERFVLNPLTGYSELSPDPGDLVRGWVFGPIYQGYWLDPGRTAVCGGQPTPEQRALVEDCADFVQRIIDAVRPGVRVRDVAALGNRMKADLGGGASQGGEMWPYFGHGNGSMWESPRIHATLAGPDEKFEAGMVASSELFLSRPGVGCAGIEQNYIVTDTGTEVITTSPLVWW